MQAISLWLAAAIVILTGWAIVKKYQVNMVLFIAGLLLNIIGVMNGATNFLPKNATATGLLGFDFFELFRAICRTQIAGVGFIILVSGGFAQYMKDVGASDRFVTVCAKPITLLKNPYLILGLVFIIGHCLGLVITSAAGLAMLLIVTVYPLIIRVGCSSLSAAAVVASVLCVGYAPASGVAVMAAELVHLDPVEYLVSYQLVMAAPVVLVMAITHLCLHAGSSAGSSPHLQQDGLQDHYDERCNRHVPFLVRLLPRRPSRQKRGQEVLRPVLLHV